MHTSVKVTKTPSLASQEKTFEILTLWVKKVYRMVRLLLSGPYTPPTGRKIKVRPYPKRKLFE